MWTVIYVSYDEDEAQNIQNRLRNEGFLVKIRNLGKDEEDIFEILVPESEADEAHDVIDQEY